MNNPRINTLKNIFTNSNNLFLTRDLDLILTNVNERGLCGALAQHLNIELKNSEFDNYFVDVEYNRNNGKVKTIIGNDFKVVTINCDIIIHSRGRNIKKDNLLAIEMKKSNRPEMEKIDDKNRLIALTKLSYDGVWSNDGIALPEHVCGYDLGIYYEINIKTKTILLEYYIKGELNNTEILNF